jgi:hypothetical protein
VHLKEAQAQFEERLQALDDDSRACAAFAYTEYTLWHVAGYDFDVQRVLNEHKEFWWPILAALHQSAYIALGRMFDDDNRTHNLRGLLEFAHKWQGMFKRNALEDRKILDGLDPALARTYAVDAYELRNGGLASLMALLAEKEKFYKSRVEAIRDKIFAHRDRAANREQLFKNLMLRDMEQLIVFPLQIYRAMFGLYHNGREPLLPPAPSIISDVLKGIPPAGTSTWEHLHTAKYTKEFLDWLKAVSAEAGGDA